MENIASARPAAWGKAGSFWLLTNALGSARYLCYLEFGERMNGDNADLGPLVAVGIVTFFTLGSLVFIPIAVPVFRRLLALPKRRQRLLAVGTAVIIIFVFVFVSLPLVWFISAILSSKSKASKALDGAPLGKVVSIIFKYLTIPLMIGADGWVYLPAALLAAAVVYRQELFRPDDLPS